MDLALPRSCPIAQGFDASHASDAARPSSAKDAFIATRQPNWPNLFIPICIGHDDTLYREGRATYSPCQDQNGPIAPFSVRQHQYGQVRAGAFNFHPPYPPPSVFAERESEAASSPSPASALSLCGASFKHPPLLTIPSHRPPTQLRQHEHPASTCLPRRCVYYSPCKPPPTQWRRPPHAHCHRNERRHPDQCHPFETRVALVEQGACRNCMSSAASSAAM